jgi:hypothetical protein
VKKIEFFLKLQTHFWDTTRGFLSSKIVIMTIAIDPLISLCNYIYKISRSEFFIKSYDHLKLKCSDFFVVPSHFLLFSFFLSLSTNLFVFQIWVMKMNKEREHEAEGENILLWDLSGTLDIVWMNKRYDKNLKLVIVTFLKFYWLRCLVIFFS